MATHSSILAWEIPWTEEIGGLQSMGSQSQTRLSIHLRVGWREWHRAYPPGGRNLSIYLPHQESYFDYKCVPGDLRLKGTNTFRFSFCTKISLKSCAWLESIKTVHNTLGGRPWVRLARKLHGVYPDSLPKQFVYPNSLGGSFPFFSGTDIVASFTKGR